MVDGRIVGGETAVVRHRVDVGRRTRSDDRTGTVVLLGYDHDLAGRRRPAHAATERVAARCGGRRGGGGGSHGGGRRACTRGGCRGRDRCRRGGRRGGGIGGRGRRTTTS